MEDQLIIKLFFERSESAIAELSAKYGAVCERIAYRILGDERDAEECVNDACLVVWDSIPPEEPDPLQAYVYRIVRNLSLKKYHYNTAQKRNSYYDAALEEIADCLESRQSVEGELEYRELIGEVNAFLGTLKQKDRVIFIRRYWYLESVSDIADSLGLSRNSVTVNLHRTRKKLRKYLQGKEV